MRPAPIAAAAIAGLLSLGCANGVDPPATAAAPPSTRATTSTSASVTTTTVDPTTTTAATAPTSSTVPAVEIALRFDRRTTDEATADFAGAAEAILTDPRGWEQSGFRFTFGPDAPYTVMLAEASAVDAACAPYDVQSTYSCQIGPVVALNADRWRSATPTWTGSLEDYRSMLVNHEVGHLLGLHHPVDRCPTPGQPAPVMAQQSKGLEGCAPNPWPLDWELACAARHDEPIAPGYDPSSTPLCGPGDVS